MTTISYLSVLIFKFIASVKVLGKFDIQCKGVLRHTTTVILYPLYA